MGKQDPEQVRHRSGVSGGRGRRRTGFRRRPVGGDQPGYEIDGLIEGHADTGGMERMAAVDRNLLAGQWRSCWAFLILPAPW